MGKGFNVSTPKDYTNFIYQPNLEMEMKLAEEQVNLDALNKSMSLIPDYDNAPTFSAWEDLAQEDVAGLNTKMDSIVDLLRKNPNDRAALRGLKSLASEAKGLYTTGRLGDMMSKYKTFGSEVGEIKDQLKKAKGDEAAALRARLNKWQGYVGSEVAKGYSEDFGYTGFTDPVNAQTVLSDKIDPKNMIIKSSGTDTRGYGIAYINGIPTRVHPSKIKKGVYTDESGSEHEGYTSTELNIRGVNGMPFQHYYQDFESEDFDRQAIIASSVGELTSNEGWVAMKRQDFENFGGKDTTTKSGTLYAENFQDFIAKEAVNEAVTYANKHTGRTRKSTTKLFSDSFGAKSQLAQEAANRKTAQGKVEYEREAFLQYTKDGDANAYRGKMEYPPLVNTKTYKIYNEENIDNKLQTIKDIKTKVQSNVPLTFEETAELNAFEKAFDKYSDVKKWSEGDKEIISGINQNIVSQKQQINTLLEQVNTILGSEGKWKLGETTNGFNLVRGYQGSSSSPDDTKISPLLHQASELIKVANINNEVLKNNYKISDYEITRGIMMESSIDVPTINFHGSNAKVNLSNEMLVDDLFTSPTSVKAYNGVTYYDTPYNKSAPLGIKKQELLEEMNEEDGMMKYLKDNNIQLSEKHGEVALHGKFPGFNGGNEMTVVFDKTFNYFIDNLKRNFKGNPAAQEAIKIGDVYENYGNADTEIQSMLNGNLPVTKYNSENVAEQAFMHIAQQTPTEGKQYLDNYEKIGRDDSGKYYMYINGKPIQSAITKNDGTIVWKPRTFPSILAVKEYWAKKVIGGKTWEAILNE